MQSRFSKELDYPFIVDENVIKKTIKLLEDRIGEVSIIMDCTDDVSREINKVDDLLNYDNFKHKEIKRIQLVSKAKNADKYANVS